MVVVVVNGEGGDVQLISVLSLGEGGVLLPVLHSSSEEEGGLSAAVLPKAEQVSPSYI